MPYLIVEDGQSTQSYEIGEENAATGPLEPEDASRDEAFRRQRETREQDRGIPAVRNMLHVPDDRLYIAPHKDAPVLSSEKYAQQILLELGREASSANFNPNEEAIDLLREASLVNLWFFLKYVASVSGPYDLLNDKLHLQMCNFAQSRVAMEPGARAAGFIPRGHYKSTVWTHGLCAWEGLRNPDERIRIVNAVVDKAMDFLRNIRTIFDDNELMKILHPHHYVDHPNTQKRWNESELCLPNRSKAFTDPTFTAGGATGASEGSHHTKLAIDDLAGLDDLNQTMAANANMAAKKKWFATNTRALLVDLKNSRIFVAGTRYSIDDTYQPIFDDAAQFAGYPHEKFYTRPNGDWYIYYRKSLENGEVTFPESFTKEGLEKIAAQDQWTWITQYQNDPQEAGLAEFIDYEVDWAALQWSRKLGQYIIVPYAQAAYERRFGEGADTGRQDWFVRLGDCDVVMAIDPAGTETGVSSKTSRSAIGVVAFDPFGFKYLLWLRAGYFSIEKMMDLVFQGNDMFAGYLRGTVVESNAMQKILKPIFDREAKIRNKRLNTIAVPAKGDKTARIRNNVGQALANGQVVLCSGEGTEFLEEKQVFPQDKYKMDVLDMFEKAIAASNQPTAPAERDEWDRAEDRLLRERAKSKTGY